MSPTAESLWFGVVRTRWGRTIPRHRATVLVTMATMRSALCNSRGGRNPYSSGPALGRGNPLIFGIPLARLCSRWPGVWFCRRFWSGVSLLCSGSICNRCMAKTFCAHWKRRNRTWLVAVSMACARLPSSSDCSSCCRSSLWRSSGEDSRAMVSRTASFSETIWATLSARLPHSSRSAADRSLRRCDSACSSGMWFRAILPSARSQSLRVAA
mmetsp:Transcript_4150/g.11888  ORF Transcript_4150/g.11888 Transcript_4150/m.11888 type:complete len:212 (+) Transcript_4150:425-1060(+)